MIQKIVTIKFRDTLIKIWKYALICPQKDTFKIVASLHNERRQHVDKFGYIFMECFVSSGIKSQNDAFSHKETENNICRRRHGHAVVRFFSDEGVAATSSY